MPKSNLKVAPALKPRSSRVVPVSPCVLYKLHETTGGNCADALGNGPVMTLSGAATGTPRSSVGNITPNGTDHWVSVASSAYLNNLVRVDQSFGHIIFAIDYEFDGDLTASEELFYFGADSMLGGYGFYMSNNERLIIDVRPVGSGTATTYAVIGADFASYINTRMTILLEVVPTGVDTFDLLVYLNGNAMATYVGASWGGAPYGPNEAQGYCIGARLTTTGNDRKGNSGASNCKYGRFLAMRRATRDAAFAATLARELYYFKGEIPLCLNGM